MIRFFAAAFAAGAYASAAQGQQMPLPATTNSVQPFKLEQALALGGARSASISAGAAGVQAARAGRGLASLRPNPEISLESENIGGTGEYRGVRGAETTARIALPLELGGKRSARVALADAQVSRAQIAAGIALADLTLTIRQTYAAALAAERRVEIAQEQAALATESALAARARVFAGAASPIEQQRAEVLRLNADTAVERAQRTADAARLNLSRLVGQPISGSLDSAWFQQIGTFGPVESIDARGTLALALASADARIAGSQLRLARAQRIPDVTISAGARRLEATNDVAAVVGVAVAIPLFNNGRAAIEQASAQLTQAEALRQVALLEAQQTISTAQAELANAAAAARNAAGPALVAATEAARIARIGYRAGKFSQLELIEAERTLSQTRSDAVDALAAYRDAEARLARLTTSFSSSER
ncbi:MULTISPECIES: TolC family protein [Sphingomonas]|uniref:TolC family protein n=1 Tax=Sphingomonas TaxID=13687 RepID=UPI000DEFAC0C|nr:MULTISPECIES: TolC family protein [Sphingomonas]